MCWGCMVDQHGRPVVVRSTYGCYEAGLEVRLVPRNFYYLDESYGGYVVVSGLFPPRYVYPGWYVGLPPYGCGYPVIGRVHTGWNSGTVIVNNVTVSNPQIDHRAFDQHIRGRFHAPPAAPALQRGGFAPGHPQSQPRQQVAPVRQPAPPQNFGRAPAPQPQVAPRPQYQSKPATAPRKHPQPQEPQPAPATQPAPVQKYQGGTPQGGGRHR